MNRILLVGRLSKDPELKYTNANIPVCRFSIAVDRSYKAANGPSADFFDIVVWRAAGENCANYLSKGKMVGIDGRLETRTYESPDGKRKVYEVVADNVQFLSPKESAERAEKGYELPPPSDDGDLPF